MPNESTLVCYSKMTSIDCYSDYTGTCPITPRNHQAIPSLWQ